MKFLSGCIGKVLLVILCILLGVVLTLGGIVGAGYFILVSDGMMGVVEEKANESGAVTLEFSDEVKDMSILNWATGIGEIAGSLSEENGPTIGDLEKYIGMDIISSTLADFLKMDQSVIQGASLVGDETGIAAVITQEMTMKNVVEMVGDENFLPDMPLFADDSEFMQKPLKEAFSGLTEYPIGSFITVDESSAKIMRTLATIPITEIADTIPTMPLSDFIDITDDTHPVMKAISDLSINDLGTSALTDKINTMKLSDILSDMNEDDTNKVLYSLRDLTVGDLSGSAANTLINSMFLGEIMDIDSSSNKALQSLKYSCITAQYVTLTSPRYSSDLTYAYTAGPSYKYLSSNPDGSYYVAYYPETHEYTVKKSDENLPVTAHGNYAITYEIYYPTESLVDSTAVVNGITFTVVTEDDAPVVDGDKTLLAATLYVNPDDGEVSTDESTVKIKNRYHALYDEDGLFLFVNGFDDEEYKGVMLLSPECVDTGTVDTTKKSLQSYNEYKINSDGDKYFDFKAIREENEDPIAAGEKNKSVTIGDTDYPVYKFYPLQGINETMNDITLGGVMEIDESSPRIMKSLKDTKITEMGSVIDTMPLGDMIDPGDSRILHSLSKTPLNQMSTAINSLFIDELMDINDNSSRMLKALRYASLESKTTDLVASSLIQSGTPEFLAALNSSDYAAREVAYYSAYKMPDETVLNRYYYSYEEDPTTHDVTLTGVYVLYLTDTDTTKETLNSTTNLTETTFFVVKPYNDRVFVNLSTLVQKDSIDLTDTDNAEIVAAEAPENTYYYAVDGGGKITDTYYIATGTTPTVENGLTLLTHVLPMSRPQVGMNDKTNELVLADVMEITSGSSKILRNLAQTKVTKMGSRIDTMTLGEMVDTGSSKLLTALSTTTLNDLGSKVNTLFIDEFITIDSSSSQMIRSLQYATLESQLQYIDTTSPDYYYSDDLALASTTNYGYYQSLEVADYAAYVKSDSTVKNRYYYHVTDNAIDAAYILYYTENDTEKTSDGQTAFYKTTLYEQKVYSFIDITTLIDADDVDSAVGDNAAILAAEDSEKDYLHVVDGSDQITHLYEYAGGPERLVEIDFSDPNNLTETETYYAVKEGSDYVTETGHPENIKVYRVTERYNRPLIGLSDKTNELTLGDVFSEENLNSGVLSLIDSKTKLNKISTAVATAVQNSSVAVLVDTGVISGSTFATTNFTGMAKERKAFIYNSTMTDMLNGMINFIAHPITGTQINYAPVSPVQKKITKTSFASLTEFVTAYEQYDELEFTGGNVTVHIDPTVDDAKWGVYVNDVLTHYAIPIFNLIGSSSITFDTPNSEPVYIAVYSIGNTLTRSITQTTFYSLTEFTSIYAGQYNQLEFSGAVTVSIDPTDDAAFLVDTNTYAIPTFYTKGANLVTFSGANVVFTDSSAGTERTYDYGAHQAAYYYDATHSLTAESANIKIVDITN